VRKRIAIALLIVSVIGIATYFVSQPKKGSVEWHKREYLRATEEAWRIGLKPRWSDKIVNHWRQLRGQPNINYHAEVADHQEALIGLGYLQVRTFVVSNRPVDYVASNIWFRASVETRTNILDSFSRMSTARGANLIDIVARKDDMPKWEEMVRQADVPESGN
jgi:hypothetical protein